MCTALLALAVAVTVAAASSSASAASLSLTPSGTLASGTALVATVDAPIASVGSATQTIRGEWNPAQATLTGPVTAPNGWTPEYTTDGTIWSATLPSDLTTVKGARASGAVRSDGTSSGRQVATTTNSATSVAPEPTFPSAGGGDGYDVFTSTRFIMTAIHHSADYGGGLKISCWERATGQPCSPATYTLAGYNTSYTSNGVVVGSKVYVAVREQSSGKAGIACTDIASLPFTSCGFVEWSATIQTNQVSVFAGTLAVAGTRIYGTISDAVFSSAYRFSLYCYDTATAAACPGQPYLTGAGGQNTNWGNTVAYASVFGGKVFVAGMDLWCFVAADGSPCSGWGTAGSPAGVALGNGVTNPVPRRDTSGNVTGVCLLNDGGAMHCWDLARSSVTPPSALTTMFATYPVLSGGSLQSYAFNAFQTYWIYTTGGIYQAVKCYDWRTDAACAGFAATAWSFQRYTVTLDPVNPTCGYTYGNDGVVTQFNASLGGATCAGGPSMTLASTAAFPRLGCDGSSSLKGWGPIKLTVPGGVTVTAFRVTILDSSGVPIPGYTDLNPNAQGVVDVSSLSTSLSGQTPTISVGAVGATVTQAQNTTISATYLTDYPQLCIPLEARAACPASAPGVHAGGTMSLADIAVTGNIAEVPTSGPTTDETVHGTATRAPIAGCVGSVSGTVKLTTGSAIANELVELKAPDGTVIATTRTAADGSYAFPQTLGPATGYSVVVKGVTKSGDVEANRDTVIDFRIPPPAPAVPRVAPSLPTVSGNAVTTVVVLPGPGTVTQIGTSTRAGETTRSCSARPMRVTRASTVRITCRFTAALLEQLQVRTVRVRMVTTIRLATGKTHRVVRYVTLHRRSAAPAVTG